MEVSILLWIAAGAGGIWALGNAWLSGTAYRLRNNEGRGHLVVAVVFMAAALICAGLT